ncbi:hypothetical protein BDV93DRAFT_544708 [Ceratobasidium sp. AG-I]|nr:hypothetical protein BDV93DRAFT_544708 [Ceratobasidium sp. AG-I]
MLPDKSFDDIFRPPPGGDVTLRSSDSVEFLVHSVILGVASSVFASLLVVGTNKDAIELSEPADTISLMLRFAYPNKKLPTMTSFDMLRQCLCVAQKYDLSGMLENIDEQLATSASPQSLAHLDPSRAHQLALEFNLPSTKVVAASLAATGGTDFCDHSRLAELARSYPPASLIRLAAIQGTRARILADVLLGLYKHPISAAKESPCLFYNLSCKACQHWLKECQGTSARGGLYSLSPPSWALAWVTLVYETLLSAPLEKSDHLFDAAILEKFEGSSHVCQDCLNDFWQRRKQRGVFNGWAVGIKDELKQRLESVHHLYDL